MARRTPQNSHHAPVVVDPLAENPTPSDPPAAQRPKPDSELTPDQRRIRDLEDALAKSEGKKDSEPELDILVAPGAENNIIIHFVEDGFTALGLMWYRGQELEFEPSSQAYKDTCGRDGKSWLDLAGDDSAQIERWGKVFFRRGLWTGKPITAAADAAYPKLKSLTGEGTVDRPSEAELFAASDAEAKRRRAAPKLATAR